MTVYFRVADRYRNVRIDILSGEKVIHSVRKPKMAPGEMESIRLKKELFQGAASLKLRLEEPEGTREIQRHKIM